MEDPVVSVQEYLLRPDTATIVIKHKDDKIIPTLPARMFARDTSTETAHLMVRGYAPAI